jgi:SAM-dependent methyltransferase
MMANGTAEANREQAALWNGAAGRAWVDGQALLDRIYEPFERRLADVAAARGAAAVLDVGCGTGATTVAIAQRLGAGARAVGLDVSEPMIAAATARAGAVGASARFVVADAQVYAFEPAAFDLIVSRFGVMFFDDPVRAFANLRRASRPGGALQAIAWRSAAENPFMTAAERAAAPLLPDLPPRRPDAPGQFAFADAARVQTILEASGWGEIAIDPIDVECRFPESELLRYVTRLGPVGLALQNADEATRAAVIDAVRAAFQPFVDGDEVRFVAACWMIGARA